MKKVLLLLANGFEFYEASVFIDVIGWNLVDGDKTTKLFTCGLTQEVKSSFDQKIIVDYLASQIDVKEFDALAIPGGFEEYGYYKDAYDNQFLRVIKEFDSHEKTIASVCVAALPIGKSGILKQRQATTYNKNPIRQDVLRSYGANVIDKPVVIDKNIITCWNPSTAIDVAFILLEKLTSKNNTNFIKKIMGFDNVKNQV